MATPTPLKSQYTTIDLRSCRTIKTHPDGSAWRCQGLPGYPVYIAEGDLRTFISVGADAEKRRAAEQTLGPFNTIFPAGSRRTTLEWRFQRKGDTAVPYAIILRYYTKSDAGRGEVIVLTKVGPAQTCQVAYSTGDAGANGPGAQNRRRVSTILQLPKGTRDRRDDRKETSLNRFVPSGPGVGDLLQARAADAIGRFGDGATAAPPIEILRGRVIGQRPDNHSVQLALVKCIAHAFE
jgi:hypothetical protein